MKSLFSIRFRREIAANKFDIRLTSRSRGRIYRLLEKHYTQFLYTSETNCNYTKSIYQEVEGILFDTYGTDKLYISTNTTTFAEELEGFITGAIAPFVFDAIEAFYNKCEKPDKFQTDLNNLLHEEDISWRMANGHLFLIDNHFHDAFVLSKSQSLMSANGFSGPLEEFDEARRDLAAGDLKGAIVNSAKSFESMLKIACETTNGNASNLIRSLHDKGFFDDLPDDTRKAFGEQVLMTVPFLRNRFGGHGQGKESVTVPSEYVHLAVSLTAGLNIFMINKIVKNVKSEMAKEEQVNPSEVSVDFDFGAEKTSF